MGQHGLQKTGKWSRKGIKSLYCLSLILYPRFYNDLELFGIDTTAYNHHCDALSAILNASCFIIHSTYILVM